MGCCIRKGINKYFTKSNRSLLHPIGKKGAIIFVLSFSLAISTHKCTFHTELELADSSTLQGEKKEKKGNSQNAKL